VARTATSQSAGLPATDGTMSRSRAGLVAVACLPASCATVAPHQVGRTETKPHDGTIIADKVNEMWETDVMQVTKKADLPLWSQNKPSRRGFHSEMARRIGRRASRAGVRIAGRTQRRIVEHQFAQTRI
jgi:hypothetical protein